MKNDLPSKIKRGKPTFIRIKANKKEMKYNNDNVRRQDRLLEEDRAYALLREGEYGVLSMTTPTGGVYGIPLNFVWDGQENIYIHCAPRGRKLDCIALYPEVSFCVIGNTHVVPEQFSTNYSSIVLTCRARTGLSPEERMHALRLLMEKYTPEHLTAGGKICGKVIPPYGNHPATRGGVQWKMQTDTIKGKDAPSPFPIQKIYSSTLPALFPQAVSGATGPIHRCLQRS